MWERYCRGVSAIVYVVDSSDSEGIKTAKEELFGLLDKQALQGTPLLVLGNKNDLKGSLTQDELIKEMSLNTIKGEQLNSNNWVLKIFFFWIIGREVCCYSISAKNSVNIDITLQWLIKHGKSK